MQLKIIYRHGQCRGRPPTMGRSREGPVAVGSWQLAIFSRQSTVISQQSGTANWERRTGIIRYPNARDWISSTCSVSQGILQNGDKDRWRAPIELLLYGRMRKVCPAGNYGISELFRKKDIEGNPDSVTGLQMSKYYKKKVAWPPGVKRPVRHLTVSDE